MINESFSDWHADTYRKTLEPTSGFEAGLVERLAYVVVGREAIELGRVGDGDVALAEHLANRLAGVPVEQVVGADDDDAAPAVLEEVLEQEVGQLAERPERARQRRVGDLVVEVRIGGDPRDERNVEERRHLRHSPARCVTNVCYTTV